MNVFGGKEVAGPCRDAGVGNLSKGCKCNADKQCQSKDCSIDFPTGSQWFGECLWLIKNIKSCSV